MQINNKEIKYILTKPKTQSNKGIILLPGISGKALSDRYKDLEMALSKAGFSFLRANFWESAEDLQQKTLEDIHQIIDNSVNYMHSIGCKNIGFIGKSFGGGVLLTYPRQDINSLILLAPVIGFSEESNLNKVKNTKLLQFKKLDEIKINKEDLEKIKTPTLIIHGTADETIPLENSQKIINYLEKGKLETIEGAGHSYEKEGEMDKVIENILKFLSFK